ncbi:MAG: cytochrome c [Candidatus Rokubacteria bacterium]|nr:cytochrome c [Candidatus Rokubacteria bacterium]
MKRLSVRTLVVLGGLTALAGVGGYAFAQSGQPTPADYVAFRQRVMKLNGASWQEAQAKLKAGNAEAVALNAETMAILATWIPGMFPPGSMTSDSKAKPDIWEKRSEFDAAAKNFQAQAEKLRDAARSKDAAATQAVAKDFGRLACGGCHTPFRVPPKS